MNYFDLHCDTAYEMYVQNKGFICNGLCVSAEKGEGFNNWIQTFAVWIKEDKEEPFLFYKNALKHLKQNLKGKVKPIFAVEGGTVIGDNPDLLYELKCDGVRFLTLTWNGENLIAGGVKSEKGLTDYGKTVIKEMNRLHIACDLSHLNDKSFFSAAELAERPLATHSNCRAVCNVSRNLTDEQIKLIAEKGGIIGLNFYSAFLGGDFYTKIYQNICHICDMGFEDHIAIGSDFDGAEMPKEVCNISKIPIVFENLCRMGLEKTLLNKIFYENALKYTLNL